MGLFILADGAHGIVQVGAEAVAGWDMDPHLGPLPEPSGCVQTVGAFGNFRTEGLMRHWILTDPLRDAKAIFRQLYPQPDSFDSDGEVGAPEPLSPDEGAALMRELRYKLEVMDERGCAEFLDWAEDYLQQDSRYVETEFLRTLQALMN